MNTSDRNQKRLDGQAGFALLLVMVILMTMTVFTVGILTGSTTNSALSSNFEKSTQAVNMA